MFIYYISDIWPFLDPFPPYVMWYFGLATPSPPCQQCHLLSTPLNNRGILYPKFYSVKLKLLNCHKPHAPTAQLSPSALSHGLFWFTKKQACKWRSPFHSSPLHYLCVSMTILPWLPLPPCQRMSSFGLPPPPHVSNVILWVLPKILIS